jgi:hypothetical protein
VNEGHFDGGGDLVGNDVHRIGGKADDFGTGVL